MYKIITLLLLFSLSANAQNERLEIHHINVENGDATMIVIHDTSSTSLNPFPFKMLIDGGNSGAPTFLLPYFKKYFGTTRIPVTFKYIVLSHYHQDHYKGLLDLSTGTVMKADTIIDPGGYKLGPKYKIITPADSTTFMGSVNLKYKEALKEAFTAKFLKSRSKIINRFPQDIGKKIEIGTVNGISVFLTCIAGGGYTYGKNGNTIKKWKSTGNANNYTLGFMIQYGQFRYYTAGDMGGYGTGNCTKYIDQETNAYQGFSHLLQDTSFSFNRDSVPNKMIGHICTFKIDHHGSNCSNNDSLMKAAPATVFISAGSNSIWGLPNPAAQARIKKLCKPLSGWRSNTRPLGISDRGIYFTNLYNYTSGHGNQCLDTAKSLFHNVNGLKFSYGNNYNNNGKHGGSSNWWESRNVDYKDSYVLIVNPTNITTQSSFEVFSVNYNMDPQRASEGIFQCHRNTRP